MTLADEERAAVELFAEALEVTERLITAPFPGRFHPYCTPGTVVAQGDPIGVLFRSDEKRAVVTPFAGLLMGLLVLPGERVRAGQPVAWLTTT